MTDKPIIFSAPMIRALLDGRKTQTRRVLKRPTDHFHASLTDARIDAFGGLWWWDGENEHTRRAKRPPYATGDRLWVKETWRPQSCLQPWDLDITYAADGELRTIKDGEFGDNDWLMPKAAAHGNVSPLFMPRWASRLTLTVTDVRVQRVQDISAEDARAEGIAKDQAPGTAFWGWHDYGRGDALAKRYFADPRDSFRTLWNSIHGPDAWDQNPWVCALTFTVRKGNIDDPRSA